MASYVYGAGRYELLSRRWCPDGDGGACHDHFYHANSLGSVTALTDSSGAVLERYQYDAYG